MFQAQTAAHRGLSGPGVTAPTAADPATGDPTPKTHTPVRGQRHLQIALGLLWLIDAGLQFQPYMFGPGFANTFLFQNAVGQPAPISWLITAVGHLVAPHVAIWNTAFALTQAAIGVGLVFRPLVRPALALSFVWSLGVWLFGEGLGLIPTGSASALTGAPGSVLMYAAIGLMSWPRPDRHDSQAPDRPATHAASWASAHGIGGAVTPLATWTGYWSLAAVLFLFPYNRAQHSVSTAIAGMATGQPRPYSHFLSTFSHAFASVGTDAAFTLSAASLVIGLGPLISQRPRPFLLAGIALEVLFWVTGQGLGGVLTGSGTDPDTGPLIVLLALTMLPRSTKARLTPDVPSARPTRRPGSRRILNKI